MKRSTIASVITGITFFVGCGGGNYSDSLTTTSTTTSTTEVLSPTTSPETTLPLVPTSLNSRTFSEGPTAFTLKYGVGAPFSITSPDAEIEADCALAQLPLEGTTYQYLYFEIEIPGSRRFELPSIELGVVWNDFGTLRYQSLPELPSLSGFSDSSHICIPKTFDDLMISERSGIFSDIESDGRGGLYLNNTADSDTREVGRIFVTTEWAKKNQTDPRPVVLVRYSSMGITPFFRNQPLLSLTDYAKYVGPSTIVYLDGSSPALESEEQVTFPGKELCDRFYSSDATKGATCRIMTAGMPSPKTLAEFIDYCLIVVSPDDRGLCTEDQLLNS